MADIQLSLFPDFTEDERNENNEDATCNEGKQKRVIIQTRSKKKKENDPLEYFPFTEAQMRVFEELSRSMWGPKPGASDE